MRRQLRKNKNYDPLSCEAKIHCVTVTVDFYPHGVLPSNWFAELPGVRIKKPRRLWGQRYGLVTRITCRGGIRTILVYYKRQSWADPFRIKIIPRYRQGLQRSDLEAALAGLPHYKIVSAEVAFDFPVNSIVDMHFCQTTVLFGKSSPRFVGINPIHDSWGTRTGLKFMRVYARFETEALRIELELHSAFLRGHAINSPEDFERLVRLLPRRHIHFARFNQAALLQRLEVNGLSERTIQNIVAQVKERKEVLYDILSYLRRGPHLKNVHRLLIPIAEMNQAVADAVEKWAAEWTVTDTEQ
jgi:hypothetical protein